MNNDLEPIGYMLQRRTPSGWADAWPDDLPLEREEVLGMAQEANERLEEDTVGEQSNGSNGASHDRKKS